jgi:hypothetical protein
MMHEQGLIEPARTQGHTALPHAGEGEGGWTLFFMLIVTQERAW